MQKKSLAHAQQVNPQLIDKVAQAIQHRSGSNDNKQFFSRRLEQETINQRTLDKQSSKANISAAQEPPRELSYIEKKQLKNEKLSALWLSISKSALEQDYQRAYELALN